MQSENPVNEQKLFTTAYFKSYSCMELCKVCKIDSLEDSGKKVTKVFSHEFFAQLTLLKDDAAYPKPRETAVINIFLLFRENKLNFELPV